MKHQKLRQAVCQANKDIDAAGLAPFTWGNVSAIDRKAGIMAIKPSGVSYAVMQPRDIVVLDLASGRVLEGTKAPSSDTATHLEIYRAFKGVSAAVHTHSRFATVWAQALRAIPCYGTTHADVFHGPVPITRMLRRAEVAADYESNTGKVIVAHFKKNSLDPLALPGVLAGGHGPFTWGADAEAAVKNAQLLEALAEMAYYTAQLKADFNGIPGFLCDKHYLRKHGPNAYYGQR